MLISIMNYTLPLDESPLVQTHLNPSSSDWPDTIEALVKTSKL